MSQVNGFTIDDETGRIKLEDSPGINDWMGIPQTKNNISAGEVGGEVKVVTYRAALDANNEVVCLDVTQTPYTGTVYVSGGLPHDAAGRVLIDTASDIKYYYERLPYVASGAIAVVPNGPPPVAPTAPTNFKNTALTQADLGTFTFTPATIEAPATIKKYVAKDSLGKTADVATTGTTTLTFTWQFAKSSQHYTIQVAAVSDAGVQGPWSDAVAVDTYPDEGVVQSASSDAPAALTVSWKNNPNNGDLPVKDWQIDLWNGTGSSTSLPYNPTPVAGVYTQTITNISKEWWGSVKVAIRCTNVKGSCPVDYAKAFPVTVQPVVVPGAVNITKLEAISDTSVRVTIAKPATGSDPINYKCSVIQKDPTKAWTEDVVMTFNGAVGTGVIEGMTPATLNTIGCYGVNAAGQGDTGGATMEITMPDYSIPVAPVLDGVYPASTSVVLAYTYTDPRQTGHGLEPLFYTGYASDGTKTFKREVYDPDQDLVVYGLTNGVKYDCWVTATSIQEKEGPKSNVISATTGTQIPAPVVKSIVAGDGTATATFDPVTPDAKWTVDHYSFFAVNLDNPDAPEVEGHCVSGTAFPLENDINWSVSICAVCNPGLVPGDFSAPVKVSPEKPIVPYKPIITQAYATAAGQIQVDWVKGANGSGRTSGTTVDQWKVRFKSSDGKGNDFTQTVPGDTMKLLSDKVTIGSWEVYVSGHNDQGWGAESFPAAVTFSPTKEDPILGGQIVRGYNGDPYDYAVFYSNATTGYEAIRTATGKDMTFEVLLAGAGGAGKGNTITGGKGGDGGGGQLVYDTLPPTGSQSSIFITVPSGGKNGGDNPANATVKEGTKTITAISGKTATSKNDAEGYPKQKVAEWWNKLNMFTWLMPGSEEVGGVAQSYEQNYPDGTFCSEGGAGTKASKGGNGKESYCAIRWKKLA